jgi:hypothetical protein
MAIQAVTHRQTPYTSLILQKEIIVTTVTDMTVETVVLVVICSTAIVTIITNPLRNT